MIEPFAPSAGPFPELSASRLGAWITFSSRWLWSRRTQRRPWPALMTQPNTEEAK